MKIYARKIDQQFIDKQVSYTKEILRDFLDGKSNHDFIKCEGKTSHTSKDVEILLNTDPRFGNTIKSILKDEGDFTIDDLMLMHKAEDRYIIELVKQGTDKFNVLSSLFDVGDRHLLLAKDNENELPIRLPVNNNLYPLNAILYGVPGTGKTYSTAVYALGIIENKSIDDIKVKYPTRKDIMNAYNAYIEKHQIAFTTFHQNYAYEDFIEGLRPANIGDALNFKYHDGIFKEISDRAISDDCNYVIIIDEINRGNVSRILGVLITLIEHDKRWGEENQLSMILPSGKSFAVPNNLYILGTMNTADKSISLIDAALRRRFEFIETPVNSDLIQDDVLRQILIDMNDELLKRYQDTDKLIGHAYFINKTENDLVGIMNNSVIPLLYEYTYDKKDDVKSIINNAIKNTQYVIDDEASKYGRVKIKKS